MMPPQQATSAATIEDLHPDLLRLVLRRLDGPSLAAASCATSLLRRLASDPALWRRLCLSSFPSLRLLPDDLTHHHRSLFSDASPFPSADPLLRTAAAPLPAALVSAVDLRHGGEAVLSCVVETDPASQWFLGSPFRVDALDRKALPTTATTDSAPEEQQPPLPVGAEQAALSPGELRLDWVLIDPNTGRAVNLSSREAVSLERHWHTGEVRVKFATVVGGSAAVVITVACGKETSAVREVSMAVEDLDGVCLNGRESLVILRALLEGKRRREPAAEEEEAKGRYAEFDRRKVEKKERNVRREARMDICSMVVGFALFLASVWFVATR